MLGSVAELPKMAELKDKNGWCSDFLQTHRPASTHLTVFPAP